MERDDILKVVKGLIAKVTDLEPEEIDVNEEALAEIVDRYTREAGVRSLERELGKLSRKVATTIAREDKPAGIVTITGPGGIGKTADIGDDIGRLIQNLQTMPTPPPTESPGEVTPMTSGIADDRLAALEAAHLVGHLTLGREHDHRDLRG